jgi:hypothetical protein
MNPSLTAAWGLACLLGVAAAVAASTTLAVSTVAMTAPATSLFFHIAHPFVRQHRIDTDTLNPH